MENARDCNFAPFILFKSHSLCKLYAKKYKCAIWRLKNKYYSVLPLFITL